MECTRSSDSVDVVVFHMIVGRNTWRTLSPTEFAPNHWAGATCYKRRKSRARIVHRIVLILEIIWLALGQPLCNGCKMRRFLLIVKPFFEVTVRRWRRGGGVALYEKSLLMPTLLEIDATRPCVEILGRQFSLPSRHITVLLVCNSPSLTESDDDIVLRVLRRVARLHGECLILGDFNTPHINWLNLQLIFQQITHRCRRRVPAPSRNVTHSMKDRPIGVDGVS